MSKIILCNISDTNKTIEEERYMWVIWVLLKLHIPENIIENNEADIDTFRHELDKRGIDVEHNLSKQEVKIYKKKWFNNGKISGWLDPTDDHLIAQWTHPKIIKKIDEAGPYYELHLNEWSIFGNYKLE